MRSRTAPPSLRRSLLRIAVAGLFLVVAAANARAASAPSDTDAKMNALAEALAAKRIVHCRNHFILFRRILNTCTRVLDSLEWPVAQAKAALVAEEAAVRKLACPTRFDFGCTPDQVRHRQRADHLERAARELRLAEDVAIGDRNEAPLWDRVLVKDNRLSVILAEDFIGKAIAAHAAANALRR